MGPIGIRQPAHAFTSTTEVKSMPEFTALPRLAVGYPACLRGLPPARVLRFAASWRKCSEPNRRAVVVPPLCPMTAAGARLDCSMKSSTKAIAVRSRSRAAGVRFWGRTGLVSRIKSASETRFRSACSSRFDGFAIQLHLAPIGANCKRSLFFRQRNFQTLPFSATMISGPSTRKRIRRFPTLADL